MPYANNKCADQPAHPRSLINTFIIRCLDNIVPVVAMYEIARLQRASVAEQAGLSLTWSYTADDRFSRDVVNKDRGTEKRYDIMATRVLWLQQLRSSWNEFTTSMSWYILYEEAQNTM